MYRNVSRHAEKNKKECKKIEPDIFTQYVIKFQKTVFRVAYSYVKNTADAEDVTQEAFLRLYRSDECFSSEENVKAWLIKVTANIAKNLLGSAWTKRKATLTVVRPLGADLKMA